MNCRRKKFYCLGITVRSRTATSYVSMFCIATSLWVWSETSYAFQVEGDCYILRDKQLLAVGILHDLGAHPKRSRVLNTRIGDLLDKAIWVFPDQEDIPLASREKGLTAFTFRDSEFLFLCPAGTCSLKEIVFAQIADNGELLKDFPESYQAGKCYHLQSDMSEAKDFTRLASFKLDLEIDAGLIQEHDMPSVDCIKIFLNGSILASNKIHYRLPPATRRLPGFKHRTLGKVDVMTFEQAIESLYLRPFQVTEKEGSELKSLFEKDSIEGKIEVVDRKGCSVVDRIQFTFDDNRAIFALSDDTISQIKKNRKLGAKPESPLNYYFKAPAGSSHKEIVELVED